jgi:hypothetical protein
MRTINLVITLLAISLFVPGVNAAKDPKADGAKDWRPATPEPKSALQHNNRGVELGHHEKWMEAIAEHNLALLEDPTNKVFRQNLSAAHMRYGKCLIKKEDILPAIAELHAALFVDPENFEAVDTLKTLEGSTKDKLGGTGVGSGKGSSPLTSPDELDQFLHGDGKTLHGYDRLPPPTQPVK